MTTINNYDKSGVVVTLLNAVTGPVTGEVWKEELPRLGYAYQTVITGSPSGVNVRIEGSLDGVTWRELDTSTSTGGELKTSVLRPLAKFFRGRLHSLTGGSSPTVTLYWMPAKT